MSAPATGWPTVDFYNDCIDRLANGKGDDADVAELHLFVQARHPACALPPAAAPSPTDWPTEEAVERAMVAFCWEQRAIWPHDFLERDQKRLRKNMVAALTALAAAPSPPVEAGWRSIARGETCLDGDEIQNPDETWRPVPKHWHGDTYVTTTPIRRRFALPPVADTGGQEAVELLSQLRDEVRSNARVREDYQDFSEAERLMGKLAELLAAPPPSPGSAAMGDS